MVETVDLVKEYQQGKQPFRVLDSINLKISNGEFVSIMGPSGSGKSTLLHIIGALDKPTDGKIIFNGIDLSGLNDNQLAELRNRELGFIFQSFNLIHRMNAVENVEMPLSIFGVPRKERRGRAMKLLEMVGLKDRMKHKPSELSGGEQQRVAIARALINDPKLILCDEATGNLDSKTGQEIMGLLRKLNEEQGTTFIAVTHDPIVAQMTDRIIRLKDGRIVGEKRMAG
ncbi:ABC transporter ATP-binding protein [Candidatus Bathyarchaeota archaeon]|nr:ABC transporter ATP-binding protein [Candidatus Bathyarchaeota archaeon]MBS7630297.1 ABC transporter ATP-binding protein [Candidatus Bathyarchaeota archaeon]